MRILAPQFAEKLRGSVNTLCRAWTFTRKDGTILNLIEHDEDITIDGTLFVKANAVAIGQVESAFSLSPDSASIEGIYDANGQSETSFVLGNWNNAQAELFIVDWQSPQYFIQIWSGYVNSIKRTNIGFELDLVGSEHQLNNQIINSYNIKVSSFAASDDAPFIGGFIEFKSGILIGQKYQIKNLVRSTLVEFELASELPVLPSNGDVIDIFIGCDKSFEVCKVLFNNIQNFRGCPHMPGESVVFAGPSIANNDSGART
ncbi:MAG: Phage protein transfer agent-like protein [Hyphomonadaceae bacterium]|nr:MAG: Phage protein transfer agent-like protein [Hyphomonadaceae bacterium]